MAASTMSKALANLWLNVGKGKLLQFIAGPIVAALVLSIVPIGDIGKIVAYGIVTVVWALTFAWRWGPAPSRAADFWYYLLGMVGVILFFANSADQREKVALTQDYSQTTAHRTTLGERRQAVERIVLNQAQIVASIRDAASGHVKTLEDPQVRQSCFERDIQKRNDRYQNRPIGGGPSPPDVKIPQLIDATCDQLIWLDTLKALAAAPTAKDIAAQLKGSGDTPLRYMIGTRFDPISLDEALEYLSDPKSADEAIKKIRQEEDRDTARLDEIRSHYQDVGRGLDPGKNGDTGALQYFLWPYFILAALGLKLARVNYSGVAPVD